MAFATEVTRLEARLFPKTGEPRDVVFFLRPRSGVTETLGDRLNDPATRFLAAEIEGATELLYLDWIARLELAAGLPEIELLAQLGAQRDRVAIRLASGLELAGEVYSIMPPGRRRLSDLLNAPDWRFLLLVDEDAAHYVNRDAIASVRQR